MKYPHSKVARVEECRQMLRTVEKGCEVKAVTAMEQVKSCRRPQTRASIRGTRCCTVILGRWILGCLGDTA